MKVPTSPLNEGFQSYQYFSQIRKFISVTNYCNGFGYLLNKKKIFRSDLMVFHSEKFLDSLRCE